MAARTDTKLMLECWSERVKYSSPREDKFRTSKQPCNFLYIMLNLHNTERRLRPFFEDFRRFCKFGPKSTTNVFEPFLKISGARFFEDYRRLPKTTNPILKICFNFSRGCESQNSTFLLNIPISWFVAVNLSYPGPFLLMDVYIQERSGQSNCTRSLARSLARSLTHSLTRFWLIYSLNLN